ncbi:MAG: PorP/SprF family type IX secretion system membrane protein [Chitinophagales bacterium]|nr:PorP/SprF family type IX secretion system membrane protein [Chitinophagales bacterium]
MRRLIKVALTLAVVLTFTLNGVGQDIHFSQYYASPMTLNPALTGKFNGDYRINAIYRTQWSSIVKPFFRTPALSADLSMFKGKLKGDAFGVGVYFLNDEQNNRLFNTLKGGLSVAYHKRLDADNRTQLALGFQIGYTQKTLDDNFIFEDQYFDQFNTLLDEPEPTTIENLKGENETYFDVGAGLLFNTRFKDNINFYIGASAFHINTPQEIFLVSTGNNELPMNFVGHTGVEIKLQEKYLIIPGALLQYQAKSKEINFGSTFGYIFSGKSEEKNTDVILFLGAWYRWKDSVIPKLGLEYKNIRVGVAYDMTVSSLKNVKNATDSPKGKLPTAFEISLSYIGNFFMPKDDVYLFNPRY